VTATDTPNGAVGSPEPLELRDVEQFVYREARFADEHDYDAWEALWTDDGLYWVPANDDDIDPETQVSVIYDNRRRIATRLEQLRTGKRHAQSPKSRLRRTMTNVEIMGTEGEDTVVGANFMAVEAGERGRNLWAGRVTYRLRVVNGELKLAYKKVELVDNEYVLPTMSFLL
jgi:3-phenylpropionate/cinnamic acid dioxygenase small subunit